MIEPLEPRKLLSATYSLTPLTSADGASAQVFNDAGQVAGSVGQGGFFYSNGKTTDFQPPGGSDGLTVNSMNASGQVVGFASLAGGAGGAQEAFLFSNGTYTNLGLFGGTSSWAVAINNSGTIVGNYITDSGATHGFIYNNGKVTDIGTLGGASTEINALNNLGQIVGFSYPATGNYNAFLYSGGKMTDIDPTSESAGTAINDAGQVIGYEETSAVTGFFYAKGKLTPLQLAPGQESNASELNASGEVAGDAYNSKGDDDLFTYSNGVIKDDGGVAGDTIVAQGLNSSGEIFGYTRDLSDDFVPYIYEDGAIQRLNYDLSIIPTVDYGQGPQPQTLGSIGAINDSGDVIATAGFEDYLLTPAAPGSISGTVFDDVNNDGVQESTESPLAGRLVYDDLYDDGSFTAGDPETTTNSSGHYTLSGLAPGPYIIRFEPPTTNWKQSVQSLTLTSGENATNISFATLQQFSYQVTDLGTLGGPTSVANAVNNVGQVVGESDVSATVSHPFLYTVSTGKMTDLSSVVGATAIVTGINDLGQMVGTIPTAGDDSSGDPITRAFVYYDGKVTLLPLPAGTQNSAGVGINDSGEIVATAESDPYGMYGMTNTVGYIYTASTGKLVGSIPEPDQDVTALAINNSGQIFENSFNPEFKDSEPVGVSELYSGGKLIALPLPTGTTATGPWFGSPIDILLGNTVAPYDNAAGLPITPPASATFYTGTQAVALNDTLAAKSGWNLTVATAINSSNLIVGQGTNAQGKTHAYLATPVLASISGTVFKDSNGDGSKESDEPGLAGWTVDADLNNSAKVEASAVTNSAGQYTITGLAPGGYTLHVVAKTSFKQTTPAPAQTIVAAGQAVTGPVFGEVPIGPYSGTPAPFGLIQAENFDLGGQGTGYYNPTNINRGGLYRPAEGVGIGAIPAANGGGYFVGWTLPGEWLDYTVTVAATGIYTLDFRVASQPLGGTFHLNVDGKDVTGELTVPSTGNWNVYTTVSKTGVNLAAGTHVLQLVIDTHGTGTGAGGNFDWIEAIQTPAPNLLVNGSFSQGNTGFTSQYPYRAIAGGGYLVGSDPKDFDSTWLDIGDHTTGTGLMLEADASTVANTYVWEETVNVSAATAYSFVGWAADMHTLDTNVPKLAVYVNNVQIGATFAVPSNPGGIWSRFTATWNSGSSKTATIKIVDLDTAYAGNDFGLDDLSFAV